MAFEALSVSVYGLSRVGAFETGDSACLNGNFDIKCCEPAVKFPSSMVLPTKEEVAQAQIQLANLSTLDRTWRDKVNGFRSITVPETPEPRGRPRESCEKRRRNHKRKRTLAPKHDHLKTRFLYLGKSGTPIVKRPWKRTKGDVNRRGPLSKTMCHKPGPLGITPAMARYSAA